MKKKIALLALSLATVALIGVGATLAYFTDTATANNVLTMGKVDIELDEPNFAGDENNELKDVLPGDVITKDPTITVASDSEDCYIRTRVVFTNLDATQQEALLDKINIDDTLWFLGSDGYYYYKNKLTAGAEVVFFDEVTIPETWGNEFAAASIGLDVTAEAIQADNFTPTVNTDGMITAWTYSDGTAIVAQTYVPAGE